MFTEKKEFLDKLDEFGIPTNSVEKMFHIATDDHINYARVLASGLDFYFVFSEEGPGVLSLKALHEDNIEYYDNYHVVKALPLITSLAH